MLHFVTRTLRSPSRNPLLILLSSSIRYIYLLLIIDYWRQDRSVNQSKKQHNLAVSLLKKLRLDYVRLEPQRNGRYRYFAWSVPLVDGNGSPRISRRGVICRRFS